MSSAKLMFLLVLWLSVSRAYCARKDEVYGDGVSSPSDCQNCSICQYPCHPQPPPPSGYPSPGSPGAPPPPPGTGNCPPTSAGCCQYPQPPPPSPYTYLPYNNYSASPPMPSPTKSRVSILFTTVVLFGFVPLYLV